MGKKVLTFCLPILLLVFLIVYSSVMRPNKQESTSSADNVQPDFHTELENAELEPTRDDAIYIYRDLATDYYGLYNSATKQKITEPIYENISAMGDNGLMAATMNGYCGYIDRDGDVVIDFQYDDAYPFRKRIVSDSRNTDDVDETRFVAAVKLDGRYGVIDDSNATLIHFAYDEINVGNYFAIVCRTNSFSGALLCGASTYTDDLIVDINYSNVSTCQNSLFAEQADNTARYDVFDYSGRPRLTPEDIEVLTPYECEKILGFMKCPGNLTAVQCETGDYSRYWLLLDQFQPISDQCYRDIASYNEYNFYDDLGDREKNFTTAYAGVFYNESNMWGNTYWTWEDGSCHWVILDENGYECAELPEMKLGEAGTFYNGANAYYAYIYGTTGTYYPDICQGLVDIETGEFTEYKDVKFVPDTNCVIVQDIKTELYGIIDGDRMVRECNYTNAEWGFDGDNMYVDLTRGGLQETYYVGSE